MKNRRNRLAGSATALGLAVLAVAPAAQASPVAAPAAKSPQTKALDLMPRKIQAGLDIRMAYRRYALCAASNIARSKKTTRINGKRYRLGTGLCPIVTGWTVYNESLQGKSPRVKGASTIWSSFGNPPTYPQYDPSSKTWSVAAATPRTYVVGQSPNKEMANFWGFPCVVTKPVTIGGTRYPMAMCAGPLMENIDNRPVSKGETAFTNAPASADIPVGLAKLTGRLAGLEEFFLNPFPPAG